MTEAIDYYLVMAGVPYDRELDLDMDFRWAEPATDHRLPVHHAPEADPPACHWEPPPFTCERKLPGKRRAFLVGMASVVDLFGTTKLWNETGLYRSRHLKPNDANAMAIYSDWCAIGGDLHRATADFERTELEKVDL
jgi:hypothetical protein